MPKKKLAKKKVGGAKKSSSKVSDKAIDNAGPTPHEISLRLELESLEQELSVVKAEVEEVRKQNLWLRNELKQVDDEVSEYKEFIDKKTDKEQERIDSLSKRSQQQLDTIHTERMRRAAEYDKTKKNLNELLLSRQGDLERVQRQIIDLGEVRQLREDQDWEIKELEAEIERLGTEHGTALRELKNKHLHEKVALQREAHHTVSGLLHQASQTAVACLDEHAEQIKNENRELRRQLLQTIKENKTLQERERVLFLQNKDLSQQVELDERSPLHSTRTGRHPSRPLVARP